MNDLDRLKEEFIEEIKCERFEEAARTLAKRDELLLAELVTGSEIARLTGVTPAAVSNWITRHADFPAPRTGSGRTARYSRTEALQWFAAHDPAAAQALREQATQTLRALED